MKNLTKYRTTIVFLTFIFFGFIISSLVSMMMNVNVVSLGQGIFIWLLYIVILCFIIIVKKTKKKCKSAVAYITIIFELAEKIQQALSKRQKILNFKIQFENLFISLLKIIPWGSYITYSILIGIFIFIIILIIQSINKIAPHLYITITKGLYILHRSYWTLQGNIVNINLLGLTDGFENELILQIIN